MLNHVVSCNIIQIYFQNPIDRHPLPRLSTYLERYVILTPAGSMAPLVIHITGVGVGIYGRKNLKNFKGWNLFEKWDPA